MNYLQFILFDNKLFINDSLIFKVMNDIKEEFLGIYVFVEYVILVLVM